MTSQFLIVARQVLEKERHPMSAREIVAVGTRDRLFSDSLAGKTPYQTMKSKLSVDVRRNGERSIFVRTAPGRFYLRHLLPQGEAEYQAEPIAKPRANERVLVFDAGYLPSNMRFQGVARTWKQLYRRLLSPHVCEYMDRLAAEDLDTHKQVLTYIMVTRGDSVLAFKRGNYNRVEDFLRGSHCIGFGGHVIQEDRNLFTTSGLGVLEGAARELLEELALPKADILRLQSGEGMDVVGVLNDDSSDVGRRHFAFLLRYEVSDDSFWDDPRRGEKSITQLRWLGPGSEPRAIWHFEYWSQLCLRGFFPKLIDAAPAYRVLRRKPLHPPHLLCVIGGVGSGKSEATKVLTKTFGYREINSGRIIARLMKISPVPQTPRDVFQRKAWQFISTPNGPKRLADAILGAARRLEGPRVLIDGIRQQATLEAIRSAAEDVRIGVLFVHTTPDVAYKLYKAREASSISVDEFIRLRNAPVEREVDDMIALSDCVLYNWFGRRRYQRAIHNLMRSIQGVAE
jgi:predicted NUDIX family phosphoesterase